MSTETGTVAVIPLERAALCVDCETVFECAGGPCPKCAGTVVLMLANVLNRKPTSGALHNELAGRFRKGRR